jgi:hypothetical protein
VLSETELRVSHDLADAVRRIGLTHTLLETNYNGFLADLRTVEILRRRFRDGIDNINFLLQAQRLVVNSEISFYQSLANYNLSIRDLHREKGSLLAYNGVTLAEGPWADGAHNDAYQMGRFLETRHHPSAVKMPPPLSAGPFDPSAPQNTSPPAITAAPEIIETPPVQPAEEALPQLEAPPQQLTAPAAGVLPPAR